MIGRHEQRPKRLVYVVAALDAGGSERQMMALAERLPRALFEPSFLLFHESGPLVGRAREAGIEVRSIAGPSRRQSSRLVRGALGIPGVARALKDIRPDIVDAWLYAAYVAVGLTRFYTNVPHFVVGRRSMSELKGARTRFDHVLGKFACRSADVIVANSDAVRNDAVYSDGDDPRRIAVIRNGVQIPEPLNEKSRAQIRARWGVPADALVLACIANYKAGKGLPDLIQAIGLTSRRDPTCPAHLVLIGEGPDRDDLEGLARSLSIGDRVHLVGHEAEPGSVIGAADIAVHPSHSEGLPNAVLEASASGVPVVGTTGGGTVEAIVDRRTGFLVPPADPVALAEAISRLISDESLRREFGEAGRAFVQSTFGMDRMVNEFVALYRGLDEG